MKLYGTTTSPFVRRVRVVAGEAGVPVELVNTAADAGQAALRAISPIAKVPVAEVGDRVIFDSRSIIGWITSTHGWGRLTAPADRFADDNLVNAVDAALGSAIQVFYLRRDGLDVAAMPFAERERARIAAIFDWLGAAGRLSVEAPGLAELSLVCTLDWMEFRDTYDVSSLGGRFDAVRAALAGWTTVTVSRPHT